MEFVAPTAAELFTELVSLSAAYNQPQTTATTFVENTAFALDYPPGLNLFFFYGFKIAHVWQYQCPPVSNLGSGFSNGVTELAMRITRSREPQLGQAGLGRNCK
jgi:hypothetical protein